MPAMWPLSLPQCPLRASYKRTLPNMTVRSSMDTGPDKVRYRGGHSPQTVEAAYFLTAAQRNALETFALETIKGGAICFDWPNPENSGDYVLARLVPEGDGLLSFSPNGNGWNVNLRLEYWPDAPNGGA